MDDLLGRLRSRVREFSVGPGSTSDRDHDPAEAASELLFTKQAEFIELLEANDGRMKQSEIVAETDWSATTVSRELSAMEEDDLIHKVRVGRANMILLAGEEPEWYTPPDLPAADADEQLTIDEPAILLIEDDEQEAALLKRAFRDAGVTNPVHTVRDGVDAVDFLLQRGSFADVPRPGLVLLDLGLMAVDGLDVLRELDSREAVRQFPIIVLSHSDDPKDIQQSYDSGATGYVTKPDDLDELTAFVNAIDGFWLSNNFHQPPPGPTRTSARGDPASRG